MKYKILIFSIFMAVIVSVHGQISGIYSLNKCTFNNYTLNRVNDDITCNIYFFKSGNYYLELSENVTSDIIESLVLSYGNFSLKNNRITLIDKVHNYRMILLRNNNELQVLQAFNWLLNKRFILDDSNNGGESEFLSPKVDALTLKQERANFISSNKTMYLLKLGTYENEQGFKLDIQQSNKYELTFKNIVLSSGLWSRTGNELELHDTTLKHSFYVLINENGLISKLLPGDYTGCSLYYSSSFKK